MPTLAALDAAKTVTTCLSTEGPPALRTATATSVPAIDSTDVSTDALPLIAGQRAVASARGTAANVPTIACRRLDREVSKTYASETLTIATDASERQSRENFRYKMCRTYRRV